MTKPPSNSYTAIDIQQWLVLNISSLLGVEAEQIDIREPLDSYGLDSAQAIILASKAEMYLGLRLSLIHLWYYPTIEELTHGLVEELGNSQLETFQI